MSNPQSELLRPVTWLGGFPLVRWLLFSLVFCFIPVLTAGWLYFEGLRLIEVKRNDEVRQDLERRLFRLLALADPETELVRRARFALRRPGLRPESFGVPGTVAEIGRLRHLWGAQWDLYRFDSNGGMKTPEAISLRSRFALTRLWKTLHLSGRAGGTEFNRFRNHFRVLFGGRFRLSEARGRRGRPLPIRSGGHDGVLIWDRDSRGGGWIQVFWRVPPASLLLKTAARRPEFGDAWVGCRNRLGEITWLRGGSPEVSPFLARFDPAVDAGRPAEGRIWTGVMSGEQIVTVSLAGNVTLDLWRYAGMGLGGLLIGAFLFVSRRWLAPGGDPSFSLRERLTFLLWFAISVPVIGLGVLGLAALDEREQVLTSIRGKQAQERLLGLDAEFSRSFEGRRQLYREWAKRGSARAQSGMRVETRDRNGRLLSVQDEDSLFMGMEGLFEVFARIAWERNLHRLGAGRGGGGSSTTDLKPVDDASRMIMESPEMGFVQLFDRPDQVNVLKFAGNEMLFYWDIRQQAGGPVYFMAAEPLQSLVVGYLHDRLERSRGDRGNAFRLLARRDREDLWYPHRVRRTAALAHVTERVRLSQQPMTDRVCVGGVWYRAMAMPGSQLSDHTLVALLPTAAMDAEMRNLRLIVALVVLAALLLAGASGRRLSGTLLGPLSELARGIAAVRARETAFRVRIEGQDELAQLGRTFNQMLENLKELDLARIVQESLLPKQLKPPPGWSLALTYRSMDDLAGDYVDVLARPDGSVLVIIGDVTGHGVSSGLVMALIKAVVFEAAEESLPLPEVAERVNFTLHSVLRRRKLLTFFAGLLDIGTGRFSYINAGQTYPFLIGSGGEITEMVAPGFPLGLRADPRALETRSLTVNPGAALFFYTDGLVEARGQDDQQLGYDRVQEVLSRCGGAGAEAIRDRILESLETHRCGRPLDDDVTVLVLGRNA